jgi:molybdopterin synthase catalytic subunit
MEPVWKRPTGAANHRALARIGGMTEPMLVRLTEEPLEAAEALAFVQAPGAGGVVMFAGTVRDRSDAGEVAGLDYEAWEEMAETRMAAIAREIIERWPVCKVAILHRIGRLDVGETSVLVSCSAPHRAEAFDAARHGIERVKSDVPIWKKERLTTGEAEWVRGS